MNTSSRRISTILSVAFEVNHTGTPYLVYGKSSAGYVKTINLSDQNYGNLGVWPNKNFWPKFELGDVLKKRWEERMGKVLFYEGLDISNTIHDGRPFAQSWRSLILPEHKSECNTPNPLTFFLTHV